MENTLAKLYYDTAGSASYSSVAKLHKASRAIFPKLKIQTVKEWLKKQQAYSLHRPIKRKYSRSTYSVTAVDKLWQIDLANMSMVSNVKIILNIF